MADQFRINPAEVSTVADDLAGLGARMAGHASGLRAQVAGAGQPWGSGATGDQFASGAGGFVAHVQAWVQAMGAHAETVARHAGELAAVAGVFEQADQDS
jgi:uncharacterized protein YukE